MIFKVKWKNIIPDEDIYGNKTDLEYQGTCDAASSSEACRHYFEPEVNYITSCVQEHYVPRFMRKDNKQIKIIKKKQ